MTADVAAPAYAPASAMGRSRRVFETLRAVARGALRFRPRCLLVGHDDSFVREPRRLSLRCTACGRETAGWALGPAAPAVMKASRVSPGRSVGLDLAGRVGPWTLRRDGRGAARERERQRLVAAASRAAEPRAEDSRVRATGRPEPVGRRLAAGVAGEATAAVRTVAKWLT